MILRKQFVSFAVLLMFITVILATSGVFTAYASEVKIVMEEYVDETLLSGETKIRVGVTGLEPETTIVQTALKFEGMKYKGITFLKGEDKLPECFRNYPNAALANAEGKIMPSIVSLQSPIEGIEENGTTYLYILTFEKTDSSSTVTVTAEETDKTYYVKKLEDGKLPITGNVSITSEASEVSKSGTTATVSVEMNKLISFGSGANSSDEYSGSGIYLHLKSEDTPGYSIYTEINCALKTNGGHRENGSKPVFTVSGIVLDDSYTVEISGIGFITKTYKNVKFGETPLVITNDEFIPGDLNADGKVDSSDKALFAEAMESNSEEADFNRDGIVDDLDEVVFEGIADGGDNNQGTQPPAEEKTQVPSKPDKPTLTAKTYEIEVEWSKPSDNGSEITGYVINFGTSESNLNRKKEIDAKSTKCKLDDLSSGKKYYVKVAAVNKNGTGEFSDAASITTKASSSDGGGGGGGGGGGAKPPVQTTAPQITDTPQIAEKQEAFTDLSDYGWAKDSIYSLKEQGIISGTSATTYSPANHIKRGDFILIITRMLGIQNEFSENFADVSENSYYYNAIGSAKAAGIATGDGVNFMPESSISRQDLITLAYRAFKSAGYITANEDGDVLNQFNDKGLIAPYAEEALCAMVNAGIIMGNNGNVNPLGNATRAEVAVMCARLKALIK